MVSAVFSFNKKLKVHQLLHSCNFSHGAEGQLGWCRRSTNRKTGEVWARGGQVR